MDNLKREFMKKRNQGRGYSVGSKVWHIVFGWGKVSFPSLPYMDKVLIDLDVDKISYYVMGIGYTNHENDVQGKNLVSVPKDEVFDEVPKEMERRHALAVIGLNCTLTFMGKDYIIETKDAKLSREQVVQKANEEKENYGHTRIVLDSEETESGGEEE